MDSSAPIVLVTGTDTGVGKTAVTAGLAAALSASRLRVKVCKPAETGCEKGPDGRLLPVDGSVLARAAGGSQPLEEVVPYCFAPPLAPYAAAAAAGTTIDPAVIRRAVSAMAQSAQIVLVEGAGGLLVPLAKDFTFADLAQLLGARLVVVVGSKLGAINHSLLTFEVIAARGLPCAGYVLNDLHAAAPAADDAQAVLTNRAVIADHAERYGIGELGYVPHLGSERRQECFAPLAAALLQKLSLDAPALAERSAPHAAGGPS